MEFMRKMVIVGCSPSVRKNYKIFTLAPYVLKTYLKNNDQINRSWDIEILDYPCYESINIIIDKILKQKPVVVALSVYIWNVRMMSEIAKGIKRNFPEIIVVAGGPQFSTVNEANKFIGENQSINYIFRGEGEKPLEKFLIEYEQINVKILLDFPGITFIHDGRPYSSRIKEPDMDLNKVKSPYVTGEIDLNCHELKYYLFLEGSRGCRNRCKYCNWGSNTKLRYYPLEQIKDELSIMLNNPNTATVFICDADLFNDIDRAKEILRHSISLSPRNSWYIEGSPDYLDKETIDLLGKIDNVKISFGLQSHDNNVLNSVGRVINTERYIEKVEMLRKGAPNVRYNFGIIYGLPKQTFKSYMDSINFALSLYPSSLTLNKLVLLPGTELHENISKYGFICEEKLPNKLIETPTLSMEEMEEATKVSMFLRVIFSYPIAKKFVQKLGELCLSSSKRAFIEVVINFMDYVLKRDFFGHLEKWPEAVCTEQVDNESRAELLKMVSRPLESARFLTLLKEFAYSMTSEQLSYYQEIDEALLVYTSIEEMIGNVDLIYNKIPFDRLKKRGYEYEKLLYYLPGSDWYL